MNKNKAPIAAALGKLAAAAALALGMALAASGGETWEWPQFHGPRRDNRSDETGLLRQWPEGGPKLLWTAKGIGRGFATVAIADGRIYTAGNIGADTAVTALDLDGKPQWTAKNGTASRHQYPGSRGTPTFDGGRVYHESPNGSLVCLDAKTGKQVWGLSILERFGGRNIRWGLAESVLIDGDRLICTPGGTKVSMAALDKGTGKTVWTCEGAHDKPAYASAILVEYGGVRQIITMMSASVVGVHADTGKLLWQQKHPAYEDETVSTPVFHDGLVAVSTLGPGATQCIKLSVDGGAVSARQAWQTRALDNHHGGILLLDGHLYGTKVRREWLCLELATGKVMHRAEGVGKGSLTYADAMLYTYSEKGLVGLVKATPKEHKIISSFRVPKDGRGPNWAHPVVCNGRLYLRHDDVLYCYDVRGR